MTAKRFKIKLSDIGELMDCETKNLLAVHSIARELIPLCDLLNSLNDENKRLKKENNKLHQKIFEMRTNIALERTEISRQTYTGKKTSKEYLNATEFLNEMEKW